jgi:hypothetical protein
VVVANQSTAVVVASEIMDSFQLVPNDTQAAALTNSITAVPMHCKKNDKNTAVWNMNDPAHLYMEQFHVPGINSIHWTKLRPGNLLNYGGRPISLRNLAIQDTNLQSSGFNRGSSFLVVQGDEDDVWYVIDGNHRLKAIMDSKTIQETLEDQFGGNVPVTVFVGVPANVLGYIALLTNKTQFLGETTLNISKLGYGFSICGAMKKILEEGTQKDLEITSNLLMIQCGGEKKEKQDPMQQDPVFAQKDMEFFVKVSRRFTAEQFGAAAMIFENLQLLPPDAEKWFQEHSDKLTSPDLNWVLANRKNKVAKTKKEVGGAEWLPKDLMNLTDYGVIRLKGAHGKALLEDESGIEFARSILHVMYFYFYYIVHKSKVPTGETRTAFWKTFGDDGRLRLVQVMLEVDGADLVEAHFYKRLHCLFLATINDRCGLINYLTEWIDGVDDTLNKTMKKNLEAACRNLTLSQAAADSEQREKDKKRTLGLPQNKNLKTKDSGTSNSDTESDSEEGEEENEEPHGKASQGRLRGQSSAPALMTSKKTKKKSKKKKRIKKGGGGASVEEIAEDSELNVPSGDEDEQHAESHFCIHSLLTEGQAEGTQPISDSCLCEDPIQCLLFPATNWINVGFCRMTEDMRVAKSAESKKLSKCLESLTTDIPSFFVLYGNLAACQDAMRNLFFNDENAAELKKTVAVQKFQIWVDSRGEQHSIILFEACKVKQPSSEHNFEHLRNVRSFDSMHSALSQSLSDRVEFDIPPDALSETKYEMLVAWQHGEMFAVLGRQMTQLSSIKKLPDGAHFIWELSEGFKTYDAAAVTGFYHGFGKYDNSKHSLCTNIEKTTPDDANFNSFKDLVDLLDGTSSSDYAKLYSDPRAWARLVLQTVLEFQTGFDQDGETLNDKLKDSTPIAALNRILKCADYEVCEARLANNFEEYDAPGNLGKGLRAKVDVKSGAIFNIMGTLYTSADAARKKDDEYAFECGHDTVLVISGLVALINDSKGQSVEDPDGSKPQTPNMQVLCHAPMNNVILTALRDIKAGDAIWIEYGQQYWKQFEEEQVEIVN